MEATRDGSLLERDALTLTAVPVSGGLARLGRWGMLELTGPSAAVLRLTSSEDVEISESVAAALTAGVLLLNEELARLLFLPYAGMEAVAYDLKQGKLVCPIVHLLREPDRGLRISTVRLFPGRGVLYLTESTFALFHDDCTLAWRHDDDFGAWTIESLGLDEVRLLAGDWAGRERRQRRSVVDGTRLD